MPIDLDLGSLRALVISGPNTGGKTVALKTLGLAALLHQSGLRPPAELAALPVFDAVLADIGDRQSIEMSLSTFSGHVASIVAILRAAGERSLVLLDELTSGTDPVEGSALAQALVARLAAQARLTVVTTHFPELKEWASATDGVANAATGFDPETHAPLYRIALGRPGTSHALQTAERLGLDAAIVDDARERVAPERLRIQELLAEAEAAERAAADERAAAGAERAGGGRAAPAAPASGRPSWRPRSRRSRPRQQPSGSGPPPRRTRSSRPRARSSRRCGRRSASRAGATGSRGGRRRRRGSATDGSAPPPSARRAERAIQAFDAPLPLTGPLAAGRPGRGADARRARDDRGDRGRRGRGGGPGGPPAARAARAASAVGAPRASARRAPVRVVAAARGDVSDELDVRGQRAQEAREAVRSFVDDAALAGLPSVRVVHGRGTGAVRAAVREELDGHPLVERRESDSADGATVAHLAG